MGLLGKAAVVIYSDYPEEYRDEHARFHSYEHLLERVSTAGFLRGRRCNTRDRTSPSTFALYEVADKKVTIEGEYIDKLNNPTPWTEKFRPLQQYASRTLCEVVASTGWGTGRHVLTTRFAPASGRAEALRRWVCDELMPELEPGETRIAAHFLMRDFSIERPLTQEEILCAQGAGSMQADWILVVEGWDEQVLRSLPDTVLGSARLEAHGAAPGVVHDVFSLSHVLTREELVRTQSS